MENDSDNSDELCCTPPEVREAAKQATENLLPEKSKKTYDIAYKNFMEWRLRKNTSSFSENNVLAYFVELADKYKSSSLWTIYSMLRSTLNIYENINIENYNKLRSFLKRKSDGYRAKKAEIFTADEISKFINEAPDKKYLATKVALIMGVMGCCRSIELYCMKLTHVHDHGSTFLVDIPHTKNKNPRQFSTTGPYYNIVKTYKNLRPRHATAENFFLNYQHGKCTVQIIGINKFRSFDKEIAEYLNLPNAQKYTGHCLRRSSATIFTDGGANTLHLKLHGGWKSTSVAEGYVERSLTNKVNTANTILQQLQPSTSLDNYNSIQNSDITRSINATAVSNNVVLPVNVNTVSNSENNNSNLNIADIPAINFTNCTNFTVNLHLK